MRIVVIEFMSLDGVVQAPGGPDEDTDGGFAHGGWAHPFFDDVVGGGFDDALSKADALLYGRRTWQTMAAAWPERAGDPFADRMNSVRKYVVTSTLDDDQLTWSNTTRIPGDEAVARIRELRDSDGGDNQPDYDQDYGELKECLLQAAPGTYERAALKAADALALDLKQDDCDQRYRNQYGRECQSVFDTH